MRPEKRELVLAAVMGMAAGPVYVLAGPDRFMAWYAAVLGGGLFSTVHWLKDLRPSRAAWLVWLAWPLVMAVGAGLSLLACGLVLRLLAEGGG